MDISEIIFTSLAPLLYNLIFISLWIGWFLYHRDDSKKHLRKYFDLYLKQSTFFYSITALIVLIFMFLLFSYAIWNTDVDDAITSGVQAFLNGHNPYQEDVVIHDTPDGIVLGRYHYFPPDLLTYSLFYLLGGQFFLPLLGTYWFVPLHLILLVPGYWIVSQVVDWPHQRLFPFFSLLIVPFLFTNSMLMWFFFVLGYYFINIKNHQTIGTICYVFAASIKYMVGFIILFYMIEVFRNYFISLKDTKKFTAEIKPLEPYIISSLALALISIPFNLFDVIYSVFVYQGVVGVREEVAQSVGPLLIEILKIFNLELLFLPCVFTIVIVALFLLRHNSTYDKIMHFSFLSMLLLPFYGTELFITLPFFWLFQEKSTYQKKEM
ncbi:MAG: hypothetical protein ACTSW1_03445 [Candidatus Hodarchaeales archaeon]